MIYKTLCIDEETLDVKLMPTSSFHNSGIRYEDLTLFANVISEIKNLWYMQQKAFDVSIDPSFGSFPVAIDFPVKGPNTQDIAREYQKKIRDLISGKTFPLMEINVDFRGRLDVSASTAVSTNSDQSDNVDAENELSDDEMQRIITANEISIEIHNLWMSVRRNFEVLINPRATKALPVVIDIPIFRAEIKELVNQYVEKFYAIIRGKDFPAIRFTVYDDGRIIATDNSVQK